MLLAIVPILAVLVFITFLAFMFFTREDKNKLFVRFVLLAFPLIATTILPGGLGINNFDLVTLIFYIFFYKRRKTESVRAGTIYLILFIIIILVGIAGCINAASLTDETLRTAIEFFAVFIFGKIIVDECLDDPSFYYVIINCLKITLLVSLGFLACQFVFGVEFSLSRTLNGNVLQDDGIRYPSFFQDPQKYAQFLAATSFLFLIKEWGQVKLPVKNYIFLVLSLIGLLYTGGRAGLGGWALGFSLIVLFGNATYKIYAVLVAIALFIVVYNFQDSFAVFNRSDSIADSYDFRNGIWKDAYGIFLDNALFGIAPGNYANYVSVHNPDQFWFINNEVSYYDHPESGYLKILTEFGAIGFIATMLYIIIPMINSFFLYLKYRDTSFLLLISSILSWMLGFYTVYSLGDVRIEILIVTIISLLIISYKRFVPEDEDETEEDSQEELALYAQ